MKKQTTKNFGTYIDRNYKVIRGSFLQVFKDAGVDITTEQWVLIDCLYKQNGISQNELATESFKDAPTVSRIVDLLCKKELTERKRAEDDRRRHKVFLTKKGKAAYEKLLPKVLDLRQKGWEGLSESDYQTFLKVMNQIFDNISRK